MTKPKLTVGLGEVLWDVLPSGKVLGGAPANFAYMTNLLGDRGVVASRVGIDQFGREACATMALLGVSTQYIQVDSQHQTGTAEVAIDDSGQPVFKIKESVSWDFLEWTSDWEDLAKRADVVCFGSLAQRSRRSAATVDRFLRNTRAEAIRIFDVNLRQLYYTANVLERSLDYADIVKLTDQELARVAALIGMECEGDEDCAKRILRQFGMKLVCVTRGSRGSMLVSDAETVEHPGFRVDVVDSVGAGDAFTACLVHHFMRGRPLGEINELANRLASWVATQTGATPPVDRQELRNIVTGNAFGAEKA